MNKPPSRITDYESRLTLSGLWTVVPVQQRKPYMEALEQASSYRYIRPLATFFATLVREQTLEPMPFPGR